MKEEEILALIAAPFMAQWVGGVPKRLYLTLQLQDYSDARDRALYQARQLLQHAADAVHGPDN